MRCKYYGCDGKSFVVDSRSDNETETIWRMRKCDTCKRRWKTVEVVTERTWMEKSICTEDGCSRYTRLGSRLCQEHKAKHAASWNRQVVSDLKFKERRCKNHPNRDATMKAAMLLCNECLREYHRNWDKKKRKKKNDQKNPKRKKLRPLLAPDEWVELLEDKGNHGERPSN